MGDVGSRIQELAIFAPLLIFSLSFHEFAHAWSASKLGDETAARMGRLTLHPKAHIDLIGTIIFPLIAFLWHAPLIGWANPVPVNPLRFRRDITMSAGMAITAAAGPIANLILALVSAMVLTIVLLLLRAIGTDGGWLSGMVVTFFMQGVVLNVTLAVFNMIPVPPLDGSRILRHMLPRQYQEAYDRLQSFGMLILYGIMFTGLLEYFFIPAEWLIRLILGVVGAAVGV